MSKRKNLEVSDKSSKLHRDTEFFNHIYRFQQEGWSVNKSNDFGEIVNSNGWNWNLAHFPRNEKDEFFYFKKFFSDDLLSQITTSLNNNRELALNNNKISNGNKKFYRTPFSEIEFLNFYGIILFLENNYSRKKKSIRKLYKSLRDKYGEAPVGFNRFAAFMKCFIPSDEEIENFSKIISENSLSFINGNGIIAYDELMVSYNISKSAKKKYELMKDPAPAKYIPRKPHPNGMLFYLSAIKDPDAYEVNTTTTKAFVINIQPVLFSTTTGPASLEKVISEFPIKRCHWIADAAFSSEEIFNTFTNNNQYATISFSSTHNTFLWKVMQFGVYSNLFKTTKKNNLIASIITSNEGDDFHKVISNGFIVYENQPSSVITSTSSAIPNSTELESTSVAVIPNSTELESTSAVQSELDFSLENLKKKKLKELKEIAKKHKITLGKGCTKKEDIVKKISSYLNPDESETQERERLINDLTIYNFTENPAIHQAYKKNFNLVDLHDREWYKFPFSFHVKHWRTKMMISLLSIAIVNSSTAYLKHQRSSGYLSFREKLEEKLLEKSKQ